MPASRLRVTGGPAAGSVLEIETELTFGRAEEGAGRLGGDPELSRSHARVYVEPAGGLAVEDLGSTNGTFVNGERVTGPRPLPPGSTLRLGQTDLTVEAVDAGAAPTQAGAVPVAPPAPPPPPLAPPPPPLAPPPPPAGPAAGEPPPPPPTDPAFGIPPQPPPAAPAPTTQPGGGRGRLIAAAIVGLLALGGAIAAVLLVTGGGDDEPAELPAEGPPALVSAARAAGCTAVTDPSEGANHVQVPPRYKSNPPHSGDHSLRAAPDGPHEDAPPIGELVHALEHGRIIMWHKPGNDDVVRELRDIGREDPEHMILTPNETGMEYEAAATAWTHLLGCPEWNDDVPDAIRAFRDAYRDKGPEFVP